MIYDENILFPENHGENCKQNGKTFDEHGNLIECGCDECDCFLECFPEYLPIRQGKLNAEEISELLWKFSTKN